MTDPAAPETDAPAAASARPAAARWTRRRIAATAAIVAGLLVVLVGLAVAGTGAWLRSDGGRAFLVETVSGTKTGRFGTLAIEGVSGDPLDDFTVARLTIADAEGVWLEAEDVRIDWRWTALLARRFHAENLTAGRIRLLRQPTPEDSDDPPGDMPVGVFIDRFAAEIELMEDFSKDYGHWTLAGAAAVHRRGDGAVSLDAQSLDRPGDFLKGTARFGGDIADLRLDLRAEEARGGPLAGALGFAHDQPFHVSARADGQVVDAVVRSGRHTPLRVQGRFAEEGSRLSAFIDFGGSTLLAPLAERFGRTARLGLAILPTPGAAEGRTARHDLAWVLQADNLSSRGQGRVNLSDRRSPEGLRLTVETPSLTGLAGATLGGRGVYSGLLSGGVDDWRLAGTLTLSDADLASWRARSIAGPVELRHARGRFDLTGALTAAGGSPEGVIGGLLGAAPRLRIEAAQLADGALLFQRIEATGHALTVNGSGSRGLTGRLAFRGRAEITDAGRLNPGAAGAFSAGIEASSGGGRDPWRIAFDGRGRDLVLGLSELDRLLGREPRLQIDGRWTGTELQVERAQLTGAEGNASADGRIGGDGALGLALAWSAQGPFGVGPLEIAGAMSGDGELTGTLAAPRADLNAAFDRVTFDRLALSQARMTLSFVGGDDGSDGRIVVTAGSDHGPARAAANFHIGGDRLRLTEVDLDAGGVVARGAVTLADNFPSSADLAFRAQPGAFLSAGQLNGRIRLTDSGGDDSAILAVTGRNLRLVGSPQVLRSVYLSGRGTLERLPFILNIDLGGSTPARFDGDGVYSNTGTAQSVTLSGSGNIRDVAFSSRSPAVFAVAADGRVARIDMNVGGGVLLGDLRTDSNATLMQIDLTSVELGALASDLRGRVTGRVALRGRGDDLSGSANVTLTGARSIDAPRGLAIDGAVNAQLIDNQLRIQADARSGDQVRASANLELPVEAAAAPLRLAIVRNRPMAGQVSAQGQVQPIWDLFFGGDQSLAGVIDLDARLEGSLAAPRINGRLNVDAGTFRDSASGLRLTALSLASRFDDEVAVVQSFSAQDGAGGSVSGQGRLALREGGGSSVQLDFTRFRIIDNDIARARASGPVTVTRPAGGDITLAGRLDIDEARIEANVPGATGIVRMDVVEINRPGGDPDEETAPRRTGPRIALDIRLRSPNGNVRVIGRGLNVEMTVDARVGGTIVQPTLDGSAQVVRGDYEFAGKRFVFDDDGNVSLSTDPARIRLNLQATRDDPALTAGIRVTGTAARPEIALTSTPELPQDEILSQVLFGRSASQLSPIEAAQLASGVAALAGGAGFDVIGNLRELAGLDRLSFGGEASALTVAGGRYITDDVYLEIIGGGEGGAAVNVEWQVRRNLTVSSKFGGQGEASLSIRWRRESERRDRRPNR